MNLLFLAEHVLETLYRAETNTLCPIGRTSYAELLYYCKKIAKPAVLPNDECSDDGLYDWSQPMDLDIP